jgi:hypothetical protein
MNIFQLSTGEQVVPKSSYEQEGYELIPDGTKVVAVVEGASWGEYNNERYISLKWRVMSPDSLKNRVVFGKLHVHAQKPAKSDNARTMLATIDLLGGGKLSKVQGEVTDLELTRCLVNTIATIKVGLWEIEDSVKKNADGTPKVNRGNYVIGVGPRGEVAAAPVAAKPAVRNMEDDIPF